MKNNLFYLVLLIVACKPNNSSSKQPVLSDKVQLIFTNESAYPITGVSVFTDNFLGSPKNIGERGAIGRTILPQEADTLFFDSFNAGAFFISAFFLVNNDTIKKMMRGNDNASDYTLTNGTVKFGLYYSEEMTLKYTREIVE